MSKCVELPKKNKNKNKNLNGLKIGLILIDDCIFIRFTPTVLLGLNVFVYFPSSVSTESTSP